MSEEPVVVTIEVGRSIDRVFAYYTERIADWWPLASHFGEWGRHRLLHHRGPRWGAHN